MSGFKHKLVLLVVIVLSIGICYKVSSYTYAKIQSNINYTIKPSEDAFIAIPDTIELRATRLVSVTRTLLDKEEFAKYEEKIKSEKQDMITLLKDEEEKSYQLTETTESISQSNSNFTITNNMNHMIWVSSGDSFGPYSKSDAGIINFHNVSIAPGQSWEVPYNLDVSLQSQSFELLIRVEWQEGTANLYKTVNLTVDTQEEEKVVDLRSKNKEPKSEPSEDGLQKELEEKLPENGNPSEVTPVAGGPSQDN